MKAEPGAGCLARSQVPEGRRLHPGRRPSGRILHLALKRLKRAVLYGFLRGTAVLGRYFPLEWAVLVGALLGRIAYRLDGRRAARARRQIALALPMVDADRTAAASYAHLGRLVIEVLRLPVSRDRLKGWVELPPAAKRCLQDALREDKGVIFVTGHIGNWELLAHRVVAEGFDGVTVVRPSPNPYLGRWLASQRTAGGIEIIDRRGAGSTRQLLGALKRGALLGLLIDQRTDVASVCVPFFGRPAPTPRAAAALALRGRRPVVVATIERVSNTRHRIAVERVPLPTSGDRDAQTLQLTTALTAALEAALRRAPAQWVWLHERWPAI